MDRRTVTRRQFLTRSSTLAGMLLLAGCAQPTATPVPEPTKVAATAVPPTKALATAVPTSQAPGATAAPTQAPAVNIPKPLNFSTPGWRSLPGYAKMPEPVTIKVARAMPPTTNFPAGDSPLNNICTRYIKEILDVTIAHAFEAPGAQFAEKLNLALTAGEYPDALVVNDLQLAQLAEADALADLTPFVPSLLDPSIKMRFDLGGDELIKTGMFGNKILGLPGPAVLANAANWLWVRKDWMDKLGIPLPASMTAADIAALAKAFVEKDPDGNGKNDTIGLTGSPLFTLLNNNHGFKSLFNLHRAYPRTWFRNAAGQVIYGSIAPEMKDALKLVADWYKAGLIDREFATRKSSDELVAANTCGMFFGPWWMPTGPLPNSIKNDPKAQWVPIRAPVDAQGKYYCSAPSLSSGSYLAVRKGFKYPEAVIKTLNVQFCVNASINDAPKKYDGMASFWTAVLPFNFEVGGPTGLRDTAIRLRLAMDGKLPLDQLTADETKYYDQCRASKADPKNVAAWADCMARVEASLLLNSDITYVSMLSAASRVVPAEMAWANLLKLEDQALIQIIVGEKPVDYFDAFVKDWLAQGGSAITAKVQKAVG